MSLSSSARPLRIGVVKPNWGVAGGFERLLARLLVGLTDAGHRVEERSFPALLTPRPVWGQAGSQRQWPRHPEFFRYMAMVEDVRRLELDRYDLVLSTQPPTYLVDHPRVLSLFYHQTRIFYDLAETWLHLGEVDATDHRVATEEVRATDKALFGGVQHFLAGSNECAGRLAEYWAVPSEKVSLLHAPALAQPPSTPPPWSPDGPVVCVSRHEWPKRTELAVAAAHVSGRRTELIGGGGRLDYVKSLDARLTADPEFIHTDEAANFWLGSALKTIGSETQRTSPVAFLGNVDDQTRDNRYAECSVVLAPAFREDYGLTALEAMLWDRPVVVCRDGGGLVDLVEDTGGGMVVDPTPQAVADAIERLTTDVQFTQELLARARDGVAAYTWSRAYQQLSTAVEAALA